MTISPVGLRLVLCPGSMPDPSFEGDYKKIYACWRETWEHAFEELKIDKPFYSDVFTRQDYVVSIFHNDKCISLAFLRWMDGSRSEFAKDSYFSNWNDNHRAVLLSRGPRVIVCCQFTVHPSFRGKPLGISTKDLLMGVITETFMNSEADSMTGAVRVDRGVSSVGEKWGAFVIDRKVACDFGEKNTDLIGFFKDYIALQPKHELQSIVERLWNDRTLIPRQNLETQYEKAFPKKNFKAVPGGS